MSVARRVAKNILSLLLSEAIFQLLSLSVILYIARILGPASFGNLNYAMAVISYFVLITNLGLPLLGIREVSRDRSRVKEYLVSITSTRLTVLLPSLILIACIFQFLVFTIEANYLILIYGVGLIPNVFLIDWLFQGLEKMEYVAVGRILNIIVYCSLVFALVHTPEDIMFIPAFQVMGIVTAVTVLLVIFIRIFGNVRLGWNAAAMKKMLSSALPLGICQIMIQVIYNIDTIMLGFYVSSDAIGFYNAAYKIILAIVLAGSIYFDSIFPLISQYYRTALNQMQHVQVFSTRLVSIFVFPMTIGGVILAEPIILLLYGNEYAAGIDSLRILLCMASFIFINSIFGRGLWASDRQRIFLRIVTAQAAVNILLNLAFIPWAGIEGAALSTLAAELVGIYLYYSEFNKIVNIPLPAPFIKPAVASAIMGGLLMASREVMELHLSILIIMGTVIYFTALYLLKGITGEDARTIRALLFGEQPSKGYSGEDSDRLS
ncbi:MAG: flippase [Syntrophaceae bacterium]|nr:flippase [Syntrophaceae bacterium]